MQSAYNARRCGHGRGRPRKGPARVSSHTARPGLYTQMHVAKVPRTLLDEATCVYVYIYMYISFYFFLSLFLLLLLPSFPHIRSMAPDWPQTHWDPRPTSGQFTHGYNYSLFFFYLISSIYLFIVFFFFPFLFDETIWRTDGILFHILFVFVIFALLAYMDQLSFFFGWGGCRTGSGKTNKLKKKRMEGSYTQFSGKKQVPSNDIMAARSTINRNMRFFIRWLL